MKPKEPNLEKMCYVTIILLIILVFVAMSGASNLNIIIYNNSVNISQGELSNKYPCWVDSNYVFSLPRYNDELVNNIENRNYQLMMDCVSRKDLEECNKNSLMKDLDSNNCNNNLKQCEEKTNNKYSQEYVDNQKFKINLLLGGLFGVSAFFMVIIIVMIGRRK